MMMPLSNNDAIADRACNDAIGISFPRMQKVFLTLQCECLVAAIGITFCINNMMYYCLVTEVRIVNDIIGVPCRNSR